MNRTPLYSRSAQRRVLLPTGLPLISGAVAGAAEPTGSPAQANPPDARFGLRLRRRLRRHERWLWALAMLALATVAGWPAWQQQTQRVPTMEQIDVAMRESIAKEPLASAEAAAYEAILPSVVRVVGEQASDDDAPAAQASPADKAKPGAAKPGPPDSKAKGHRQNRQARGAQTSPDDSLEAAPGGKGGRADQGRSVGTGVVVVDKGLILTNLHVVAGARRIMVTFFDGSESEAVVVSLQPENDLAVLQAKTIPDDLHAATLRSTQGLSPGDGVVAVGFPFGIGPSASTGVVSGLKREFRSPEGQRILTNLIQFDAAANPGNSGGPLVTLDGHVVGIVTAIMNPNRQRTFIGIGFAVPIENAAAAAGMPPF